MEKETPKSLQEETEKKALEKFPRQLQNSVYAGYDAMQPYREMWIKGYIEACLSSDYVLQERDAFAMGLIEWMSNDWQQFHSHWYQRNNSGGKIELIDPYSTTKPAFTIFELLSKYKEHLGNLTRAAKLDKQGNE